MTDFLSRLIERSTGRAAVAHPVMAPLFATGHSLAAEPARDGEGEAASFPATSEPAVWSAELPLSTSRVEDPVASVTPPIGAAPVPGSFELTRFPPAVDRPLLDTRRERIGEDRLASEPRSPEGFLVSQVRIEGRAAGSRDGGTDERGSVEIRGQAPPRVLPSWEPPRRVRAAATEHPRTLDPPPPPIVRVSIGRIEVRAISPPAPSARVPPARKDDRLSLEEYLKPSGRR